MADLSVPMGGLGPSPERGVPGLGDGECENGGRARLRRADLDPEPLAQFRAWFDAARRAGVAEPEAMTLATATPEGVPSARTVLFRGFEEQRLLFFTNYESRKGRELERNPHAALLFYWRGPEGEREPDGGREAQAIGKRQVRIEGRVRRALSATTERYFAQRPRASQLGAWASPQSAVLADRKALERRVEECVRELEGRERLAPPPYWGGYALEAQAFEFWQERAHRLHDRFRYERDGESWTIARLAP